VGHVLAFLDRADAFYVLERRMKGGVHDVALTSQVIHQQLEETVYHKSLTSAFDNNNHTSYTSRIGSMISATVKFFNPHHEEIAYNGTLNINTTPRQKRTSPISLLHIAAE